MKQNRKFKIVVILLLTIVCMFSCTVIVHADIGPKDQLTVHVKNPPNEIYYLDLLTQDTNTYDNFYNEGERESLNQDMLSLLYSHESEGWKPALVEGTGAPMWGSLVGEPDGDEMIHTFGYVGVPDTYRIIIVTESGKVSVSDVFTRKALNSSIIYDYTSGKATVPHIWVSYIIQFLTTCIPTLIIEGMILLLFGFKFKENYKVFLLVNISTQVVLTFTLGVALIQKGPFTAYFTQFPIEIVIVIVETFLYCQLLHGKSIGRRSAYGVTANIVSWAVGFFLLSYQYQLLTSFI